MDQALEELRYPIGVPSFAEDPGPEDRERALGEIERLPARLAAAVTDLSDEQLDTPYRPGGWTVRQVVHHLTDSHINGYVRLRWAVTEDDPLIKVYDREAWAELPDARSAPVALSLELLQTLHRRWVDFMRMMPEELWERTFRHPEGGDWTLNRLVQLYAWHGNHHLAHITGLRERSGW